MHTTVASSHEKTLHVNELLFLLSLAVGAHWYNICEPLSSVDPLTLGHVILMFLINTTMYMFLTVYIENVFPSEYGVRKPWYYIFQVSLY